MSAQARKTDNGKSTERQPRSREYNIRNSPAANCYLSSLRSAQRPLSTLSARSAETTLSVSRSETETTLFRTYFT